MGTRYPRHALAWTPTVALAAQLLALLGCEQPRPRCSVARGEFAAVYKLRSGTGPCAMLQGELLGVQAYNAPRSSSDSRPDYGATSVGIQPAALSALLASAGDVAADDEDRPYGLGPFRASEPDAEDLCVVPTLTTARVRLPAIPERVDACTTTPAQPATDVSYAFRNVRVYANAGAYGTQLAADLTYTRDGCSAEYEVWAVYPAVACGVALPGSDVGADDAGSEPALDAGDGERADAGPAIDPATGEPCPAQEAPSPPQGPDETLCAAEPDLEAGRPVGSGINSAFAITCDPNLLLCVPSAEPPALR